MSSLSPRPLSSHRMSSSTAIGRSSSLKEVSSPTNNHNHENPNGGGGGGITRSHSSSFQPQSSNFDINAEPQNYVLVDGQKYRVRRQRSFNTTNSDGMDAVASSVDSLDMSTSSYHQYSHQQHPSNADDDVMMSPRLTLGGDLSVSGSRNAAFRYSNSNVAQQQPSQQQQQTVIQLQEQIESLKRSLSSAQQKIRDQALELEQKNEKIRQLEVENQTLKTSVAAATSIASSTVAGQASKRGRNLHIDASDSSHGGVAFLSSTAPPSILAPHLLTNGMDSKDLHMMDYVTPQATTDRKFFPTTTPSSAASGTRSVTSAMSTTGSPDSIASSGAPETLSIGSRRGTASSIATYQEDFDATTIASSSTMMMIRGASANTPQPCTSPRHAVGNETTTKTDTVRKSQSKMSSSRSKLGKFKLSNTNHNGGRDTPSPFQTVGALSLQPTGSAASSGFGEEQEYDGYKSRMAASHDSSYEDPDRSFQGMTRSENYCDFDGMLAGDEEDDRSALTADSSSHYDMDSHSHSRQTSATHRTSAPSPYGMAQQDLLISGPGDETPTLRNASTRKVMSASTTSNNKSASASSSMPLSASTNNLKKALSNQSAAVATSSSSSSLFRWKNHAQSHPNHAMPYIFIFHDNPQLTKTIASHINGVTGNKSNGGGSMEVIFESHESKEMARFLFGSIIFSGDYEEVEEACALSAEEVRGGNVLIACNLRAIQGNLKHFPTRPSPTKADIVEFDFSGQNSNGSTVKVVDVSTNDKLTNFLSPCHARVDLVLDPYHDGRHFWYPYYEGSRKMAPQFRSKGIGYVRLGDDMSNYGIAFLSLDAGKNYLDNHGATNIVDKHATTLGGTLNRSMSMDSVNSPVPTSSQQSKKADTLRKMVTTNRNTNSNGGESPKGTPEVVAKISPRVSPRMGAAHSTGVSDESISKSVNKIHEMLQGMEQQGAFSTGNTSGSAMKWSDKVDYLTKLTTMFTDLSSVLDRVFTASSSSNTGSNHSIILVNLLSKLLDMFTKQSNPNVTIALVKLVQTFADCSMLIATTTYSLPWRCIVIELFYSIRSTNKSISEHALTALTTLHQGYCLPWTLIASLMNDVIVGSRGNASTGVGGNAADAKGNKKVGTSSITTAANTFKILTWFQQSMIQDLKCLIQSLQGEVIDLDLLDCYMINKQDFLTFTTKIYSVVAHREEATRELASNVLAILFVTEAFQTILNQSYTSDATSGGPKSPIPSSSSTGVGGGFPSVRTIMKHLEALQSVRPAVDNEVLQGWVCEETKTLMKEMKVASKGVAGGLSSSKLLDKMNGSITSTLKACVEEMKVVVSQAPPTPQIAARSAAILGTSTIPPAGTTTGTGSVPNSARGSGGVKKLSPSLSRAASFKSTVSELTTGSNHGIDDDVNENEALSINRDNMRILKSRNSSARSRGGSRSSQSPRPAVPSSATNNSTEAGKTDSSLLSLSGKWYEIKLLLKSIPTSEEHWNHAVKIAKSAPKHFSTFQTMSKQANVPVGQLIRIVLPFDEETSSADQSSVTKRDEQVLMQTIRNIPSLQEYVDDIFSLRKEFSAIRKLVRIKMADQADFHQATTAITTLNSFLHDCERAMATSKEADASFTSFSSLVDILERM